MCTTCLLLLSMLLLDSNVILSVFNLCIPSLSASLPGGFPISNAWLVNFKKMMIIHDFEEVLVEILDCLMVSSSKWTISNSIHLILTLIITKMLLLSSYVVCCVYCLNGKANGIELWVILRLAGDHLYSRLLFTIIVL